MSIRVVGADYEGMPREQRGEHQRPQHPTTVRLDVEDCPEPIEVDLQFLAGSQSATRTVAA